MDGIKQIVDAINQINTQGLQGTQGVDGVSYSNIIDILFVDFLILKNSNSFVKGAYYNVTDLSDRGVLFFASQNNLISNFVYNKMLCPATYATNLDIFGNNWLGIWNVNLLPVINDLVIWGGKVWKNVSGNNGNFIDQVTLDAEWLLIPKTSFTNNEYIEMIFNAYFDFSYNEIVYQWDNFNNHVSRYLIGYSFGFDIIQATDWNINLVSTKIFNNKGAFFNNTNNGEIQGNNCLAIFNNSNGGLINYNTCAGFLSNNKNLGAIHNNLMTGEITDNVNDGSISYNIGGSIMLNLNVGAIQRNYAIESIYGNSNSDNIFLNICNSIYNNSNVGVIEGNHVTDILSNSNNGEIRENQNNGDIQDNSHDGDIIYNINNGDIYSLTSSNPASIHHNTNNGYITGNKVTDVSNAQVNK